jgi:hypothetical protein
MSALTDFSAYRLQGGMLHAVKDQHEQGLFIRCGKCFRLFCAQVHKMLRTTSHCALLASRGIPVV